MDFHPIFARRQAHFTVNVVFALLNFRSGLFSNQGRQRYEHNDGLVQRFIVERYFSLSSSSGCWTAQKNESNPTNRGQGNEIVGNQGHGIALGAGSEVEMTDNRLEGNDEPQLLDAR